MAHTTKKEQCKVLSTIGARNYATEDREENDYYATPPKAVELLLQREQFRKVIWECACGEGHISRVLETNGHSVFSSDLIDRGYGVKMDFLSEKSVPEEIVGKEFDLITNPPYSKSLEFVRHALDLLKPGCKAAMFLKIQFLEGKERRKLYDELPPKTVYISSGRLVCAKNGDFEAYKGANAVGYAWFLWEKGWTGETVLKWFN